MTDEELADIRLQLTDPFRVVTFSRRTGQGLVDRLDAVAAERDELRSEITRHHADFQKWEDMADRAVKRAKQAEADHPNKRVVLVPVEVFGTDRCCLHHPDGVDLDDGPNRDCEAIGHGLMDAVHWRSDCNRAEGHIYRFEDFDGDRLEGESLAVWVDPEEFDRFSTTRFGDPT